MASTGIGFDDYRPDSLNYKVTKDADYKSYVYPYMLRDYGSGLLGIDNSQGLYSAGFWRDDNWMVMLF